MRSTGSGGGTSGAPIGKVRYVGDYHKAMFEQGEVYDLLAIESAPFGEEYRVYSPNFDDDGVFPKSEFEVVTANI